MRIPFNYFLLQSIMFNMYTAIKICILIINRHQKTLLYLFCSFGCKLCSPLSNGRPTLNRAKTSKTVSTCIYIHFWYKYFGRSLLIWVRIKNSRMRDCPSSHLAWFVFAVYCQSRHIFPLDLVVRGCKQSHNVLVFTIRSDVF